MSPFPGRPRHDVPRWIDPTWAWYFLTICTRQKDQQQLAAVPVAMGVVDAWKKYDEMGKCRVAVITCMPDHVHVVVSSDQPISKVVSDFKRFTARTHRVLWQDNYFDHRVRSTDQLVAKCHYVLQNPVRAGLVAEAGAWPYSVSMVGWP
jgi:putative transposase